MVDRVHNRDSSSSGPPLRYSSVSSSSGSNDEAAFINQEDRDALQLEEIRRSRTSRSSHSGSTGSVSSEHYAGRPRDASSNERVAEQHHDVALLEDALNPEKPKGANGKTERESTKPVLMYRRKTFCLVACYVPVLVIPWVLVCVLSVRPLDATSYVSQWGGLSAQRLLSILGWNVAVRVLNSIQGVATIPFVSALLAQAAVVYTQRRHENQSLSIRQTFALADRGWSDIPLLWKAFGSEESGAGSRFLWFAMLFVAISAVQQPVQQLFVQFEQITVMTCLDGPVVNCDRSHFNIVVGYDPEPGDMTQAPQNVVVQELSNKLASYTDLEFQPFLWPDNPYGDKDLVDSFSLPQMRQTLFWYGRDQFDPNRTYFATNIQNGTTTGVLREHAMRFNSSVQCDQIPRSSFPSTCSGARPFETSFNRTGLSAIRVCVPGEYGVFPWTLSRNRQDIAEEIFIDLFIPDRNILGEEGLFPSRNFTLHCRAGTTRGYFELGNYQNNFSYGPLIEKWPNPEETALDFNDFRNAGYDYALPTENDTTLSQSEPYQINWGQHPMDPFETRSLFASGPLMTSAVAIFGNSSFFHVAANASNSTSPHALTQICAQSNIPFARAGLLKFDQFQGRCFDAGTGSPFFQDDDEELAAFMNSWTYAFNDTDTAEESFSASMFFANHALLSSSASAGYPFSVREIYTSPGVTIVKPSVPLAGKIVISVLIFLQLLGIALTVQFIYRAPTWTPALDALAMARIGASMDKKDLPTIGSVTKADKDKLRKVDGLVGVVEDGEYEDKAGSGVSESTKVRLALGAPGLITRKLGPKRRKKKKGSRTKEGSKENSRSALVQELNLISFLDDSNPRLDTDRKVSDTASRDASQDKSGPAITELLRAGNPTDAFEVVNKSVVPDEPEKIRGEVLAWSSPDKQVDWIVTTGGTGFGVRDCTPETIEQLLERKAPGLIHLMMSASIAHTPFATLSRPVAGTIGKTLVVTLPGSPKAVKENMEALLKDNVILHAIDLIRGGSGKDVHSTLNPASVQRGDNHGGHHHHHHHHDHHAPVPRTVLSHDPSAPVTARNRISPYSLISLEEAQSLIASNIKCLPPQKKLTAPALRGHVLAEDVHAPQNVPSSSTTSVDGYALRSSDPPGVYKVATPRTHALSEPLPRGTIYRINTGAPLPNGTDTVIMVEDTRVESTYRTDEGEEEEQEVETLAQVPTGENVRLPGSDVRAGELVLPEGAKVTSAGGEIGTLAFVGRKEVSVYKKPVVAILSTGNELQDLRDSPDASKPADGFGGIWDTNRPSLQAVLEGLGYEVVDLGIVKDTIASHVEAIRRGLTELGADILVSTGGTSMGPSDLLKPVIERELDGSIHFGRVAVKPGKPTTFATLPFQGQNGQAEKPVFALPGNPASALVTFYVFVLPALRMMSGVPASEAHLPRVRVRVADRMRLDPRTEFHRVVIKSESGSGGKGLRACSTGGQRSSRVASLSGANGLVVLPQLQRAKDGEAGKEWLEEGEEVEAVVVSEIVMG